MSGNVWGLRMRWQSRIAVATLVGVWSLGVTAAEPVPSAEIEALFAEKRAERRTRTGLPLTIAFRSDGRMEGVVHVGNGRDRGRWWAKDGRLCYQWNKLANARRSCLSVVRDDGRIIVGSLWHGGFDELEGWLAGGPWRPR